MPPGFAAIGKAARAQCAGGLFAAYDACMTDFELPEDVRAHVDSLAAEVETEFASVQLDPGAFYEIELCFASTNALADSWEHGKMAAKIRWGTDGAMKRCIRLARKYMTDPGGYCATRHKHATGEWPTTGGEHGIPS